MDPDAVEIRVLGCLVEKQRTTPDVYPLSLNALRLACNQATNRDPVVDYDEATVSDALRRLALRGWTRLTSGAGSRARKYRHLLPEALGLDPAEVSLLAVLMLRGLQTPGELKQRSERLHGFADLAAVEETLDGLVERGWVARLQRRPGQKEDRFEQLLGGGEGDEIVAPGGEVSATAGDAPAGDTAGGRGSSRTAGGNSTTPVADEAPESAADPEAAPGRHSPVERIARLEQEVAALRAELARLREALGDA